MDENALLTEAMTMLAKQPNSLFIGQNVRYGAGIAMHKHLANVPDSQRIEFPVAEELQLGVSTGLALQGFLPISIFPRMDFMLRAMDQLVNHLDKMYAMSRGQFNPKVIIRARVGGKTPLDAGPQHTQDYGPALSYMLTNVIILRIKSAVEIMDKYSLAVFDPRSVVVIEAL